ncbi:GGDEF domain-containing protein [Mucisphaera calidilacus]|uniref:diguanylate cyclase n=1 Tax=Mucisphaera calidilacus TaxID=2527982 RepID=A0A518BYF5_9BACT|nr:GGDEF domain-containing protein [Mucisphaera calidilacus]QDU71994.1 putative diguanylate cyclase YedQ [Mucisphaera calidilacus]
MEERENRRVTADLSDGLRLTDELSVDELSLPEVAWPRHGLTTTLRGILTGGVVAAGVAGGLGWWLGGPLLSAAAVAGVAGYAHWRLSRGVVQSLGNLIDRLELTSCNPTSELVEKLPLEREDEIGQVARAMARVCRNSIRKGFEAQQLRRTIDQRVRLATRKATSRLQRETLRDPMTDLGNRRFLEEQGPKLFDATEASDLSLLCVAIDLDHFKAVNDTLGHAAGDDVLVFVGSLIKATTREDDMAVRLGGDEFLVLMPGADFDRGLKFAAQLRSLFTQQTGLLTRGGPKPDLSIGIAERLSDRCDSLQSLMERADERLYTAKRNGRGRAEAG